MSTPMISLEELIKTLPPEAQVEVKDFVEFLVTKQQPKTGKPLRQDWAGALRDYRHKYTALDLQHRALEWRGD